MKTTIIFTISTFLLFASCNGQENDKQIQDKQKAKNMNALKEAPYNVSDDGDGSKSDYDNLAPELIKSAQSALEQKAFKFPSEEEFNISVQEVFKFNLSEYKNTIIALRPSMFPEIALKDNRFILLQDAGDKEPYYINPDLLHHYNAYVFYRKKDAYAWLQAKAPETLKDLVVYYGFNGDKQLVEWVLKKFDFQSLSNVETLLFSNSDSGKVLKSPILEDIENVVYKGPTEDLSYAKEGEGYIQIGPIIEKISTAPKEYNNPDKTIAHLLNRELSVGITGDAEHYLGKHPDYIQTLKEQHYYEFSRLKEYIEYVYQPREKEGLSYIIEDPDGYTNLRKEKNTSSTIIQKINSGEEIEVLGREGDWWQVQTSKGNRGYIHKSRIKEQ